MIAAYIVVREETHVDDKYWVCTDLADALKIAADVTAYWAAKYGDGEVDTTLYDGLLFHHDQEDAFRVSVEGVDIRQAGEVGRSTK